MPKNEPPIVTGFSGSDGRQRLMVGRLFPANVNYIRLL
jgi:hypothetical protein